MDSIQVDDVTFTQEPDGSVTRRAIRSHSLPAILLYSAMGVGFVTLVYIASRQVIPNADTVIWLPVLVSLIGAAFFVAMTYFIFRETQIPVLRFNAQTRVIESPGDRHTHPVAYTDIEAIETSKGLTTSAGLAHYSILIVLKDDQEIRLATVSGDEADALARGKALVKMITTATGARSFGPLAELPAGRARTAPAVARPKPAQATAAAIPAPAPQPAQATAPAPQPPAQPAPASDHVGAITQALIRLQQEGQPGSTLILRPAGIPGAHIRITRQAQQRMLQAEAAGNTLLGAEQQLDSTRQTRFFTLGWTAPYGDSAYYRREWMAVSDEERERIARQLLRALTETYGWNADTELDIEMHLGADSPAEAGPTR